ncbi:hypothetical protein [Roseicella aquatilis]|uniref:Uncharacterized protein n=1 Tax=Roseicella aquatilis TaxID=2527868 RepID=A0A4R4DEM5_9PROT|nr:hypothetical protein [Roseicella aquatilis]TCZ57839.1 hypothetical protein EXY23_17920 [Roseicella aquatilis]
MRAAPLLLLLLAPPAAAQAPRCGYGGGLEALRTAERALRGGGAAPDLPGGRAAAEAAAGALSEATSVLAGCGCARAAELTQEAGWLAEQAAFESTAERIRTVLDRARLSLGLARERLDRRGCG